MSSDALTPEEVIGAAVRAFRRATGMTQAELGERLAALGVGPGWQSSVVDLEKGHRRIGWDDVLALSAIFGVSPQSLMVVRKGGTAYVKVGRKHLSVDEWYSAMRITTADEMALPDSIEAAVTAARAGVETASEALHQSMTKERDRALSERLKYPGPTFVADEDVVVPVPFTGWSFDLAPVKLRAGMPYVARDDLEAAALTAAEQAGRVRQIDRYTARRLRARLERQYEGTDA